MTSAGDIFSEENIRELLVNDWKIKDDELPDDTKEWKTDFICCKLKNVNWEFEDFMKELEKEINEGKTFDELLTIFCV